MSTIPTRVKRWLKTTNYVLLTRETLQTLLWLLDTAKSLFSQTPQAPPARDEHIAIDAAIAHLDAEIADIQRRLGRSQDE